MRIRLSDNIESVRAEPLTRPATQRPAIASASTSVELSSTARALTAALAQELLTAGGGELRELLLERDRVLLTWASQLLAGSDDGEQLELLARDLLLFRREALEPVSPRALATRVMLRPEVASSAPLALPLLSSEDESLARSMLRQIGTRETVLDRELVRRLVEPDRAGRTVSLRFLHRLVLSLWPRASALDPHAHGMIARRDARVVLATALSAFAVSQAELVQTSPEQRAQGTKRLAAQLSALVLIDREFAAAPLRPFATLTRNDRAVLMLLHAADVARGGDGEQVEQVLRALLTLRLAERAELGSDAVEEREPLEQTNDEDARLAQEAPRALSERRAELEALSGYESRTQLAARVVSSYRGLAIEREPLSPPLADALHAAPGELPVSVRDDLRGGRVLGFLAPIDLTQALGLGALVTQCHVRALRTRRARRRRNNAIRALRAIGRRRRHRDAREQLEELLA